MFAYKNRSEVGNLGPRLSRRAELFFEGPERWGDRLTPNSLGLTAIALVFGGIVRMVPNLPILAFLGTLGVLAWFFSEPNQGDEARWMSFLSLLSVGLIYLGLGHCLGLLVLPVLGLAYLVSKR